MKIHKEQLIYLSQFLKLFKPKDRKQLIRWFGKEFKERNEKLDSTDRIASGIKSHIKNDEENNYWLKAYKEAMKKGKIKSFAFILIDYRNLTT